MRLILLLFTLVLAPHLHGQCCCLHHSLFVRTPDSAHVGGRWNYTFTPVGREAVRASMHQVRDDPFALLIRLPTGCGTSTATYTLQRNSLDFVMHVTLIDLPGDVPLPAITVPFKPGYHPVFNVSEIDRCTAHYLEPHAVMPKSPFHCGHGKLAFVQREDGHTLMPTDLTDWQREGTSPSPINYGRQQATFAGGEAVLASLVRSRLDPRLVEELEAPTTLRAWILVNENGSPMQVDVDQGAHPPLSWEFQRVLYTIQGWEPPLLERPVAGKHPDRTFVAQRTWVPVAFTADPAMIWRPMSADRFTLGPSAPKAGHPLQGTFHWHGGSGGRYHAEAKVLPPKGTDDRATVLVTFEDRSGDIDIYTDERAQEHTFPIGTLPTGRYRLRVDVPHGRFAPVIGVDRYEVFEFEVQ